MLCVKRICILAIISRRLPRPRHRVAGEVNILRIRTQFFLHRIAPLAWITTYMIHPDRVPVKHFREWSKTGRAAMPQVRTIRGMCLKAIPTAIT